MDGAGVPAATATGYLGRGVSNNVSEYSGLRACLQRAAARVRRSRPTGAVVIQGDSMLTTRQLQGKWGCRSPALRGLFEECCALAQMLTAEDVDLRVQHIFREFNTVADALSNEAVDRGDQSGPSPDWGGD